MANFKQEIEQVAKGKSETIEGNDADAPWRSQCFEKEISPRRWVGILDEWHLDVVLRSRLALSAVALRQSNLPKIHAPDRPR